MLKPVNFGRYADPTRKFGQSTATRTDLPKPGQAEENDLAG